MLGSNPGTVKHQSTALPLRHRGVQWTGALYFTVLDAKTLFSSSGVSDRILFWFTFRNVFISGRVCCRVEFVLDLNSGIRAW